MITKSEEITDPLHEMHGWYRIRRCCDRCQRDLYGEVIQSSPGGNRNHVTDICTVCRSVNKYVSKLMERSVTDAAGNVWSIGREEDRSTVEFWFKDHADWLRYTTNNEVPSEVKKAFEG